MKELYNIIFKRKSVRKFDKSQTLAREDLDLIKQKLDNLIPLIDDINIKFVITEREDTTAKRGEYCLLMYSEKKPHYLLNAGYMLEQMDLFLASKNIGVCWYGLAKTTETQAGGLDFVIMLAFGKSSADDFRKDIKEFKRKDREIIWNGSFDPKIVDAVRLAPSACNSQPWRIFNNDNIVKVYRNTKAKSFIPAKNLPYYNSIDMGICLCFLEIALLNGGYEFSRDLICHDNNDSELIEVANYKIK